MNSLQLYYLIYSFLFCVISMGIGDNFSNGIIKYKPTNIAILFTVLIIVSLINIIFIFGWYFSYILINEPANSGRVVPAMLGILPWVFCATIYNNLQKISKE